jgi:hypothetical protein
VIVQFFQRHDGQKNVVFLKAEKAAWVVHQDVGIQHKNFAVRGFGGFKIFIGGGHGLNPVGKNHTKQKREWRKKTPDAVRREMKKKQARLAIPADSGSMIYRFFGRAARQHKNTGARPSAVCRDKNGRPKRTPPSFCAAFFRPVFPDE